MRPMIAGIIKRPVTAIVSIVALVVFAAVSLTSMNLKLTPDMSIPYMVVITAYPGAAPEEIDELVTDPISDACESISGLKHTSGQSGNNRSTVMMQFAYGTNMDDVYADVREAVDALKNDLPDGVMDPVIMEIDTSAMSDIQLSITSDNPDEDVLETVKNSIEPEFKKIPTLAQVTLYGGREKYIRVEVIPEYAAQYGLDVSSIADAISSVNFSMPTGTATFGDQKVSLSAEVKYRTVKELEQVPLTTKTGQNIHLMDVANVGYANKEADSISRYNGQNNVSVELKRKQTESAVTLSRQVNATIKELEKLYPSLNFDIISDSADEIVDSLTEVFKTVLQAVALAMLVLFIFFGDLKGSLIVASTMPVSLLATLCCMKLANFDLNIITAGSLIIAVGMMTDNAVVVLEMCFRKRDEGLDFVDAALMGAVVVSNSVITSTLTTVVVYLPMALMKGLSGQIFKSMGFTIIFALMASMFAALLLIPLCFASYKPVEKKDIITNRILDKVIRVYERVLRKALKYKKTVLLIVIGIVIGTVCLTPFLRTDLMESEDEGVAVVKMSFRPNLDLDTMDETVTRVEQFVKDSGYCKNYSSNINLSSTSATVYAYIDKDLGIKTQAVVDEWNLSFKNFSALSEISCSAGSSSGGLTSVDSHNVVIESTNLDLLKENSRALETMLKTIDGVLYTSSTVAGQGSKAKVVIDPVMAKARGFTPRQIAQMVYVNMNGTDALDVDIDSRTYTVKVQYPDKHFDTISDLEAMTFTNNMGISVPLTEIGEVKFASAPQEVTRRDGMYQATVTAYMTSTTKDKVSDEIVKQTKDYELSPEVYYGTDMETEIMNEEFAALGMSIAIAIFLVFVVMALQFNSIAVSILIMMEVPFAVVGSVLYLILTRSKISMVSLMGFLMLSGIVVNNGIILVDMALQNQDNGMDTIEALVDSGKGRLRPILMTTLTTILAMIPTSLGFGGAADSMQGMAVVIVGGLVVSTFLTLIVLPTFFLLMNSVRARFAAMSKKQSEKAAQKAKEQDEIMRKKHKEREEREERSEEEKKKRREEKERLKQEKKEKKKDKKPDNAPDDKPDEDKDKI